MNVVIFGLYAFLFWTIRSQNEKASQLLAEAHQSAKKNEALSAVKASLWENKGFLSQIDSFFVGQDGVVPFISTLETLGTSSAVKLDIGSVSEDTSKKNSDTFSESLTLKLALSGSWDNIFYFLSRLQNLPYRIEITNATIGLQGAADSIKFTTASSTSMTRVKASGEEWKATFDIRVLKLK